MGSLLDSTYQRVRRIIRADFGPRGPHKRRVCVVAGSEEAMQITLREAGIPPPQDTLCFYLSGAQLVFVAGDVDTPSFGEALAHEICHALTDQWASSPFGQPWASEGYADFVAHRSIPEPLAGLLDSFAGVRNRNGRYLVTLPDILLDTSDTPDAIAPHAGAELFVRYLWDGRARHPERWGLVADALRGRLKPGAPTIRAVEDAFDRPIDEIEPEFLAYCDRLADGLGMPRRRP